MKKLSFLCIFFISSCLGLSFTLFSPTPTSATTANATATTSATSYASQAATRTVPTRADFESAIRNIESIEHYSDYYVLDSATLASTTEFYKEYQYLFRLVADLRHVISIYDTMRTDDLIALQKTANDAVTACKLKFGITKREYAASHPNLSNNNSSNLTTSSNNSASISNSNNPTVSNNNVTTSTIKPSSPSPVSSSNPASTASTPATANSSNTSATPALTTEAAEATETTPTTEISAAALASAETSSEASDTEKNIVEPVDIPNTNNTSNSPEEPSLTNLFPQILIISIALTFIIVLIITNHRRPYHSRRPYRPGRRF